jgi:hypothetical protein
MLKKARDTTCSVVDSGGYTFGIASCFGYRFTGNHTLHPVIRPIESQLTLYASK